MRLTFRFHRGLAIDPTFSLQQTRILYLSLELGIRRISSIDEEDTYHTISSKHSGHRGLSCPLGTIKPMLITGRRFVFHLLIGPFIDALIWR